MERIIAAVRPHDLLRLKPDAPPFADEPPWVAAALARAPFVVVRRAPWLRDAAVPVGVRGETRGERFGTYLDARYIDVIHTPEDLRTRELDASRVRLPVFELLRAIAPIIDVDWGPAGSAGFELASGVPTVTRESDLDLVIRAPTPIARERAAALFDALSETAKEIGPRIDVQIETPDAAFSLEEFARSNLRVMLRHADGPRLVADPWSAS
jgi:phosphoribosyl-dephospho-CoA transferase